ncbi:MAG: DUF1918 domain-containing protein [Mycobacteriales bacterium]
MHASIGDRVHVKGHKVGDLERLGTVVEVRGSGGQPPFVVQWDHEEATRVFVPGSDTVIESVAAPPS